MLEQRGHIVWGRGGRNRQPQSAATRLHQQAPHTGAQRNEATREHFRVDPRLGGMQPRHEIRRLVRQDQFWPQFLEMADPFLAASHGEQLAVQADIPVPVQARLGKSLVESHPVTIAFSIRQSPVYVENKGCQGHSLDPSGSRNRILPDFRAIPAWRTSCSVNLAPYPCFLV